MERVEAVVTQQEAGARLDLFLAEICKISRAAAQRLIAEKQVWVNNAPQSKSYKVEAGDTLQVEILPPKQSELLAQDIPLDILFEDKHLLVVNKPKGMVVHPAAGNPDGTLVNAIMHYCGAELSGIGGEIRPGIVHRIDKDTSGLLVVAKDDETHQGLAQQFAAHSITREYQAVVYGRVKQDSGVVDAPIGRSQADRKKMAVTQWHAKQAITHYKVLASYAGFSHLQLQLETGRTHQIRVHMAELGHPLAGDAVYGPKKAIKRLQGQCLHAAKLGFIHPATKQYCEFSAKLPAYFESFLRSLGKGEWE